MKQTRSFLRWQTHLAQHLVHRQDLWRACSPVLFLLLLVVYLPSVAKANEQLVAPTSYQTMLGAASTIPSPNDPAYQNHGQYALDLINVEAAWHYTHGDPRVTVALLDTGIDFTHPELADHIHPDAYSFVGSSAQDQNGHGTLAAGIIAASTNNRLGTAGIASNVQILPIQVSPGSTRQSAAVDEQLAPAYGFEEAIRYATSPDRNGTRVVNINFATAIDDAVERTAIEEATKGGALIVAAAGNTGQNRALFPAAYDCTLGVGAVDQQGRRASFSTYGLGVDLVAPGVAINGPDVMGEKGYTAGDYALGSGTSFAAPQASGVAALLFSARPDLSAFDVREILMRSAKDLGTPGFDTEYGYGLLDAGAAMELAAVWQANSSKVLEHCTGERYRVYGSLYLDQNQNGTRDTSDASYAEAYGATSTYLELYGRNGTYLLGVTYPNHAGIFTFDVIYDANDAPYTLKLQNATFEQKLFFSAGMAGPYNIDLLTLPSQSLTVNGTLFVDTNGDGIRAGNEPAYTPTAHTPATVGLYAVNGQTPLATATSDPQGNFVFHLAYPTTTVTYELREKVANNPLAGKRLYTLTVDPTMTDPISYAIGVGAEASLPSGQAQVSNPTPTNLQVITHTGRVVLSWVTPLSLNTDSVFEVAYAHQPGGPYQALAMTELGQTTHATLFDLPGAAADRDYYFVVRARTRTEDPTFWSGYSNEAVLRATSPEPVDPEQPTSIQLFLPLIQR